MEGMITTLMQARGCKTGKGISFSLQLLKIKLEVTDKGNLDQKHSRFSVLYVLFLYFKAILWNLQVVFSISCMSVRVRQTDMGLCNCTQDMQKSKSLSCILSLHIGRNKVWPFPRQHSLGVLHPAHGQAACLTPLLQEGTASLEQELVLTFSELPTNCCCLTACTTSSLLPLSCVVYCIFSLVLTYCCFISLFSYLFFFFLQTQCSSLATLISVFSPYPFHFPASLPSARNLEIDFSSSAVHFCVAPSKEENALPR